MKKLFSLIISFFLYAILASHSPAASTISQPSSPSDIAKISEAMGFMIGKNLEELGLKLDVSSIVKGLSEAAQGKNSPMSEEDCVAAIIQMQENALLEEAEKNLQLANLFLQENAQKGNVIEIAPGKLQYQIEKPGDGATVQSYNCPLVRYTGRYLDGTVFGSSLEPETISLDDAIEGFSKGIIGMKEGEKRLLFIHPDLGYKTTGLLSPNSLLTFEIEVLQADTSSPESQAYESLKKITDELSTPLLYEERKNR